MKPEVTTVVLTDPYTPESLRFEELNPGEAFAMGTYTPDSEPYGLYVKLGAFQERDHAGRGSSLLPAMDLLKLRLALFNPNAIVVRIRLDITLKHRLEA